MPGSSRSISKKQPSSPKPKPKPKPKPGEWGILQAYLDRKLTDKELLRKLRDHFYRSHFQLIDHSARLDPNRDRVSGIEEVIFAEGKTPAQLLKIVLGVLPPSGKKTDLLITRLAAGDFAELRAKYEKHRGEFPLRYFPEARLAHTVSRSGKLKLVKRGAAILTAGSSDVPVAEECFEVLSYWGIESKRFYDVGVAGLGRLLGVIDEVRKYRVVVVAAGMEAALASVVGGLVPAPVIAVPTSVGYGANFKGLSSLLGMMNSCSPGVMVVNIDNGFGAAAAVRKLLRGG